MGSILLHIPDENEYAQLTEVAASYGRTPTGLVTDVVKLLVIDRSVFGKLASSQQAAAIELLPEFYDYLRGALYPADETAYIMARINEFLMSSHSSLEAWVASANARSTQQRYAMVAAVYRTFLQHKSGLMGAVGLTAADLDPEFIVPSEVPPDFIPPLEEEP